MTGRRQLTLMSEDEMDAMGASTFAQLREQRPLSQDPSVNEYVVCVARAILEVVPPEHGPDDGRWEVLIFEDSAPNAFALPGGKVGVNAGIVEVATTPGQLAAVLGHEVSHVLLRHGNERLSQSMLTDATLRAATTAVGAASPGYREMVSRGLGVGAELGVLLPFSRKHENEADQVGQMLMAQAGFYPAEAIVFWQSMAEQNGASPKQWKSTHPSDDTRIRRLHDNLPRSIAAYEAARAAGRRPSCEPPPDEWIRPEALP
jgi:predicted Zn-dependent protease